MKEKLKKVGNWAKEHKKGIIVLAAGLASGVACKMILVDKVVIPNLKLRKAQKELWDSLHNRDADFSIFTQNYYGKYDKSAQPLLDMDAGQMAEYWAKDGRTYSMMNKVPVADMGKLGEEFLEKSNGLVDKDMVCDALLCFGKDEYMGFKVRDW